MSDDEDEKLYCGQLDKLPKGFTDFGTMLDCVKANQIRRYGTHKLDKRVVDRAKQLLKQERDSKNELKNLKIKMTGTRGLVAKLNRDVTLMLKSKQLNKEVDEVLLNKLQKQLAKSRKDLTDAVTRFKILESGDAVKPKSKAVKPKSKAVKPSKKAVRADKRDALLDEQRRELQSELENLLTLDKVAPNNEENFNQNLKIS
jgi:TolA-binding protein